MLYLSWLGGQGHGSSGSPPEGTDSLTNIVKVLVLGSTGHGRQVDAHAWDQLPPDLNIADYDSVILNFVPVEQDAGLRRAMRLERLPSIDQFAKLIFTQSSDVIAIGDPSIRWGPEGGEGAPEFPVTWWLPVPDSALTVVHEVGDVASTDFRWDSYFRSAAPRYAWHFDHLDEHRNLLPRYALGAVHPEAVSLGMSAEAAASTRYGKAVGALMRFGAIAEPERYEPYVLRQSGAVAWLPSPSQCSGPEAVDLILKEHTEIQTEQRAPEWLSGFQLPREYGPLGFGERWPRRTGRERASSSRISELISRPPNGGISSRGIPSGSRRGLATDS